MTAGAAPDDLAFQFDIPDNIGIGDLVRLRSEPDSPQVVVVNVLDDTYVEIQDGEGVKKIARSRLTLF